MVGVAGQDHKLRIGDLLLPGAGVGDGCEAAFAVLRRAAEAFCARLPPEKRPPALMMSLHIWALSHGIASLFARGDAGRRRLPMSAEELLEAGVLVYLRGLGIIETEEAAGSK